MIVVTRFDNSSYYINPHLIEMLEANPDTTITYQGKKIVVKDDITSIINRIIEYRKQIGISISDNE